ncbi:carboxypeptidase-like regulatory domain-containing protein [Galbibacter sp.]|uniref:carboxypeptidase-like regulatory domain-containing protein n=1 Tax=Galbibacter sp. TaxID=2918471 RepID=UPI003A8EA7A0
MIANEENLSEIHVLNISSQKGVLTDRNGYFEIPVGLNDILLFSSIQFEKKEIKIDANILKNGSLDVLLEKQVVELEEVILTLGNLTGSLEEDIQNIEIEPEVSSKTLSLLNAGVNVKTQSERRLYTARTWDFRGAAVKIDPLINAISGRTKMLRNRVKLENKTAKYNKVFENYNDSLMAIKLKIPVEKIYDFYYYCGMDSTFDSVINLNNKGQLWMFIIKKSEEYRKNNSLLSKYK